MTIQIVAETTHVFDRFRQLMDASVQRSAAARLLSTEWQGTTFRATAPGVIALGQYQDGQVSVHITLSFPATMMRGTIVGDIERSMRDAGCSGLTSR